MEENINPLSWVSKRRAKAEVKHFIKGVNPVFKTPYDCIIIGINKNGEQFQLKTINSFHSGYVKYALADKDYKIKTLKK